MLLGDMSGAEIIQLTTLITTCVTTLGGIYLAVKQLAIARNVQKIEAATNSMKDALVKETKESATRKGADDERARATAEEATLARGALEEKERSAARPMPESSLSENVSVVKEDVKVVKSDVKDVKTEVTKEVRAGVKQGIEEANKDTL